jgi:hypothetical protein
MSRASKFYTPSAVFMTDDGGEWHLRKTAAGYHVLGPWTVDSYGAWPTLEKAKAALEARAPAGQWVEP